jgi:hypothetical protein
MSMTRRAIEFVENWVSEHIDAKDYQSAGNRSQAKAFAAQCLEAAWSKGIPQTEVAETFQDLTAFMVGEIEDAHNRER